MNKNEFDFLANTFLFQRISDKTINEIHKIVHFTNKSFQKGECIFSPDCYSDSIGFVKKGTCVVQHLHPDGTFTPLNDIDIYGTFGIIAVLSKEEYPTHVFAKTQCTISFLSKNDFLKLFKLYPDIALNTAEFLAGRITFLNSKINTFSGSNVEEKLANYIITLSQKHNSLCFDFNKKHSAEAINTGRASLYRALSSLKSNKLIDYDNKKIYIIDPKGLERKSK